MKYNIISSSSSGNCYIYNDDLMIDVGVGFNKIEPYYKNIKLVLLSHEHSDHFKLRTIKKLAQERPTLKFACGDFLVNKLIKAGVEKKNIYVLQLGKTYDFGKYIIKPVEAIHDVDNFGYKITIKKIGYKILHITDTVKLNHINAKHYDFYGIEGNYKKEELLERRKEHLENGDYDLERRIMNTHTSYEECIDYFLANAKETSILEVLHQHVEKGGTKYE